MAKSQPISGPTTGYPSPMWIALGGAILTAIMIGLESFPALAIVLMDGGIALAVLAAAGLAGGWIVRWCGLRDEPWAERLIVGTGLGVGLLSLAVLGLGSLGWLTRMTALLLVGGLAVAGLARLIFDLLALNESPRAKRTDWLWLLVCPFAAIMLLAACLPPGVLWQEEGFGYDVLEYHLAVPKIFVEQGHITFLPNNVYSNFPLASEMLSLLMMVLRGQTIEAAHVCVTVNAGLASLFAAAAWLAGRRFSRTAGLAAGVLAGTTPWIAYLAGIAYVETGMLALGMCALAVALRRKAPLPLLAGLLAGLACGYKYTAVPLIALPVSFALLAGQRPWPQRLGNLLTYGCTALVAFSPWMIRNTLNTGNPFFPLAYSVLGDRSGTWDDELHARWQRAHGSAAAEQNGKPLAVRAWARSGGDFRMGTITPLLAAVAVFRRRDRWTLALLAMLVVQSAVWLTATHLFARFATVLLLPMLVLAGRAFVEDDAENEAVATPTSSHTGPLMVVVALLVGSAWNLWPLGRLYYEHTRAGGTAINAYGQTDWFVSGQWPDTKHFGAINALPPSACVMLVGEARTFYLRRPCEYAVVFNHHPLAEAVEQSQDPANVLGWLRQRGITHLLVHWGEISRLSATYGFPPALRDPRLYHSLVAAGLKETAEFGNEGNSGPYATLFEVP